MIFACPYNNGITYLVTEWVKEGKDFRTLFEKYESFASVFEAFYQIMVNQKEIEPIEKLSEEKRLEYWHRTIKISTDKAKRIKVAKAFYVIETVFQIKTD